jgi:subtilisin family serine protease
MLGLFFEPTLPAGRWTVRLRGNVVHNGAFHAWIERDDAGQSSFVAPLDNSHTIGSISCGHETIVVGSYDAHKNELPLSFFSSAGPTRDNREKPEISAPGHAVFAAHSRTGIGVVQKSGTSMAAPAVTGVVALMLSEAAARQVNLPIATIRQILRQSARQHPEQGGTGWHPRIGAGRASASAAIAAVMQIASGVPAPAPLRVVTAAARRPAAGKPRGRGKVPAKAPALPVAARPRTHPHRRARSTK